MNMNFVSPLSHINLVLIDNQDSFTYNLVDELKVLGVTLSVFRNTVNPNLVIEQLDYYSQSGKTLLMLSPGPGAPSEAGNMPSIINSVAGKYPIIGICLGHQAIVEHYQGLVGRAEAVMHGKASFMSHNHSEIFDNLPNPMTIARYHSLAANQVPSDLQVIADIDGLAMAVLHKRDRMLGFQFHPESVLTCLGSQLLLQALQFLVSEQDKVSCN